MSLSKLKLIGILVAVGFLAYAPSLNNKFVWDDEQFIYNNTYVKNFQVKKIFTENTIAGAGETSSYYRPLTTFSFAVDHAIWGLNPFGFHLTNTVLHLSAGVILFLLLLNLGISKNKSFWISAVFLAHPLQTEAVVYANSRGDSMYIFWSLLGLLAFSFLCIKKYPKLQIYNLSITLEKTQLATLTVVFYLLSILGKEIGIASLGLFFLVFLSINASSLLSNNKNKKSIFANLVSTIKKNLVQVWSLFSLLLTALSYLIFRSKVLNIPTSLNVYSPTSPYGSSMYVRLHTFTKALWTYFQLIFYPNQLHMERSLEVISQPISVWLVATIALVITIFLIGLIEFKKQKTNLTWFGFSWFIVMLVPISGILPINGLIYEHWLYMPIIGFSIMLLGIVTVIFKNKLNKILRYLLPIMILIFVILTIKQNYIWGDPIRFYKYTLSFNQSARLNNNLAMAYADVGENEKAIEFYQKAISIADFYPQSHHNLGNTYLAMGKNDLAEQSFRTAIKMNKQFYPSYGKLINIFLEKEMYEDALPLLKELARINPTDFQTGIIYLDVLYKTKNFEEAGKLLFNLEVAFGNDQRAKYQINKIVKNNSQTK